MDGLRYTYANGALIFFIIVVYLVFFKHLNNIFAKIRRKMHIYGFVGFFTPIWQEISNIFTEIICQSFLYFVSFFTLILTAIYGIVTNSISNKTERKFMQKAIRTKFVKTLFVYTVISSRWYNNLHVKDAKYVAIASGIIFASSLVLRHQVLCGFAPTNLFLTIYFAVVYLTFLANTIFRMSVRLGNALDARHPNIIFILKLHIFKGENR